MLSTMDDCHLLHGNDRRFVDILRMPKSCFVRLCDLLQQHGVRNTRSLSVEEQVMMFLLIVGHGDSTRRSGYEWHHSTETVSRHFNNICSRIVGLAPQLIGPPDFNNIPPLIANNSRYFPYFRPAYRNRKGYTSQNVLAVVDFDLKFTYLVAGWEGSVHDARVLREAMSDPAFSFPTPPGVSINTLSDEDAHDEDDMDQGGDTIGQDAAPSTQQEEGHQTEMGRFRDALTESMWACRNQN
ncbi:hypothetical protein UlMin_002807 [Ulmus minor]